MDSLWQDLRYAWRSLGRRPLFVISVVVLLVLGVGANVTFFSLISTAFLQGLPGIQDMDRVAVIYNSDLNEPGGPPLPVSYPNYEDLKRDAEVFEDIAAFRWIRPNFLSGSRPERIHAQYATRNYFDVLGTQIAFGRFFTDSDFERREKVIVVNHSFWRSHLQSDPDIVGKLVNLNNLQFTVIGVAERGFRGTNTFIGPDLWFPMHMFEEMSDFGPNMQNREWQMFDLIGRLADGTTLDNAETATSLIGDRLRSQFPQQNKSLGLSVMPMSEATLPQGESSRYLGAGALTMAIVGVLLLIACANIASLMLARSLERRQEIAIRLAMGAKRGRIVRQLLAESMTLAAIGGVLAVVVAIWAPKYLWSFHPPFVMGWTIEPRLDAMVLGFSLLVTLICGLLFGLAPAITASNPDLVTSLKDQSRGGGPGRTRGLMRRAIVVGQVALSVVALMGAGLVLRSLGESMRIDPGFRVDDVIIMNFNLGAQGYSTEEAVTFHRRLYSAIASTPGVRTMSVADNRPLMPGAVYQQVRIDGDTSSRAEEGYRIRTDTITPEYLETLGIQILEGRGIESTDRAGGQLVAVVNREMAERFWPDGAIGRHFNFTAGNQVYDFEVVGVAENANYLALGERPMMSFYLAMEQIPHIYAGDVCLFIGTEGPSAPLLQTLRTHAQAIDPELPFSHIYNMTEVIDGSLWGQRVGSLLLGIFAILALVLASVGLYGTMTYSVSERRREIGIRMALGAERGQIRGLVLRQALWVVGAGLLIGLALAFFTGRLIASILYGVEVGDPIVFLTVTLILVGVGTLASFFPARRASNLEPATTLRDE